MALQMKQLSARPVLPARRNAVLCRAQQGQTVGQKLATAGAAAALTMGVLGGVPAAIANEFDVLGTAVPTNTYWLDDANVLSKSTRSEINKQLTLLEIQSGYRLEVVTVRKLEVETDSFVFADKIVENWYPTPEQGDKKGVLLVVTAAKEGALSGGKSFMEAVGDDLIDSIISDNIPILTEQEKYNATVLTSIERIEAKLTGKPVPEAPKRDDKVRERTYKTKEETEKSKTVTGTVVATLLLIAVVVPMLQYYGYTAKN